MKYVSPYRLATYLLVVFCTGHTAGGMLAQQSLGPAADAVFSAMKAVHFAFNGSDCTWYGFWFAYGLTSSLLLAFSAIAAWRLSSVEPGQWSAVSPIAWALFAAHVGNAVLAWKYFFVGAAATASAIALLLGVGAWRKESAARRAPPPSSPGGM